MIDKGGHSKPYLNFDQHLNNFFYCIKENDKYNGRGLFVGVVCNETHPLLPNLSCHRNELMSRPFWYCPRGEIEENFGKLREKKKHKTEKEEWNLSW